MLDEGVASGRHVPAGKKVSRDARALQAAT
jgi:hypothetical protein